MSQEESGGRIRVAPNGPYLVSGLPLRRVREIESEHGEPLTSQTTSELETPDSYALCRCGSSSRKPFCDGTHSAVGFDGTEAAPTSNYADRARVFEGTGVVMRDDRRICEHAGFCGNRLTNVWKVMSGDATEDSVVRAQLMTMVERCPSGALTHRLTADGDDIEPALVEGVGVVDDGPLSVTGGIGVTRSDKEPFETRNRMTLCRCGSSSIKPLCDGTHRKTGFADKGLT